MITRRRLAQTVSGAMVACGLGARRNGARAAAGPFDKLGDDLTRIETESRGRLGVAILDTRSRTGSGHRADERFPMCSTFKLLAASAILARVDARKDELDRRIRFEATDVVAYSPITKDRTGAPGMSLAELCEAAITVSDNTAGNMLLANLGGPAGLTAFARSLGDEVTRLDRIEPDLNEASPGDPRDTTSPTAMAADIHALLFGAALSAGSKDRLTGWLLGNKTGGARLRAGLPPDWRVGDKTGSGERGTSNDIAVIWPPEHAPVIVAVYLTGSTATSEQRDAAVAAVGRAVAATLG